MAKRAALAAVFVFSVVALWGGITLASQIGGGSSAGLSGSYPVELNMQSDICGHDQYIFSLPQPQTHHNLKLTVDTGGPGTSITITGTTPWVPVSGTLGAGGSFEVQGQGTVAGYSNTQVTFVGTLVNGQITGKYTFGNTNPPNQGGLPPCGPVGAQVSHPAVYGVKPKPGTPTPTATPPKLYSIIVIKLNDDTLQPVPGWPMNLYPGSNCTANSIDSKLTNANGLVDFEGLDPGSYSVREKDQTGWNPVGPTCRNVSLPGVVAAGGVVPPCPIQPDQPHPQPGCDVFDSAARVIVRFNQTDTVVSADLGGPVQIVRKNIATDKDADGLDEINTEIVFMQLTGSGITVRESPTRHSNGVIEEQVNTSGGLDLPANSFFDIFFEVQVGGVTLHNNTPFRLACKIDAIPPYKCLYEPAISTPIELLDANDVKVAKLLHGLHIPIPPNEVVIIFTNRPKGTPTPTPAGAATPTPTPAGAATTTPTPGAAATATPTPATAATPTHPPDVTPTPTPRPRNGDANKDGTTNPIDATFVLQFSAGLLQTINPSSDVNGDGMTNPVDGTLILQFSADLINHLPV